MREPKTSLLVFELLVLCRLLLGFWTFVCCDHVLLWLGGRWRQKLTWRKAFVDVRGNTIAKVKGLVCIEKAFDIFLYQFKILNHIVKARSQVSSG